MLIDRVRGHTFVKNWIDQRSTVVDLGANEGKFAEEMSRRYGCRIIGAEANPVLAAGLKNPPYLQCCNCAIAAAAGLVEFAVDPENSEASSLSRAVSGNGQTVKVRGVPFTDFVSEQSIDHIDLLKVDIEGAELDIFEGDLDALARVAQITVEFHIFLFEDHRPRVNAALERLQRLGFYSMSFSRQYEDTLLINTNIKPLGAVEKLALMTQKYQKGGHRILRRLTGGTVS